ncbi:hypothetical protein VTO42DRAFT_8403 [Malbranchea cinnamomea]
MLLHATLYSIPIVKCTEYHDGADPLLAYNSCVDSISILTGSGILQYDSSSPPTPLLFFSQRNLASS